MVRWKIGVVLRRGDVFEGRVCGFVFFAGLG